MLRPRVSFLPAAALITSELGEIIIKYHLVNFSVSEIQAVCEEAMTVISQKRRETDEQAKMVKIKSEKIGEEEAACKKMAKIAQEDLDEAMPILEEALLALDSLSKKDISEMKSYGRPPPKVMMVMDAICILKGVMPGWDESKRILGDQDFLKSVSLFYVLAHTTPIAATPLVPLLRSSSVPNYLNWPIIFIDVF